MMVICVIMMTFGYLDVNLIWGMFWWAQFLIKRKKRILLGVFLKFSFSFLSIILFIHCFIANDDLGLCFDHMTLEIFVFKFSILMYYMQKENCSRRLPHEHLVNPKEILFVMFHRSPSLPWYPIASAWLLNSYGNFVVYMIMHLLV